MHSLRLSLFVMLFLAVLGISGEADAGLVQIYVNDSEDLVTSEEDVTIPYGTGFTVTFHVGGDYRMDSGNENLSVYSIHLDVHFLSDTDPRSSCAICAIPTYQSLSDTESDPGYDEYLARLELDSDVFKGYSGNTQFSIIMENRTEVIVWDNVFEVTIEPELASNSNDDDDDDEDFMGVRPEFLIVGAILLIFLFFNKGRDV